MRADSHSSPFLALAQNARDISTRYQFFTSPSAFSISINHRYLNLPEDQLVERIERELLLVDALRREDGLLMAG